MPPKLLPARTIVLAILVFSPSPAVRAQNDEAKPSPPQQSHEQRVDGWGRTVPGLVKGQLPEPAPKHELSGIWEPTPNYRGGVFATGPKEYPADGKPQHSPPFTPEGEEAMKGNKPANGFGGVPVADNNDPFNICDPLGFPRVDLYNLKAIKIFQNDKQVAILYQNDQVWRSIWMDGRDLPQEINEPRWFGYSVGKWTDDTTFVVDTVGMDARTWLDNAGRPHADDLKVQEIFHRVNRDIMELTVTIDDPKMYTKPWVALNRFALRLLPDGYDFHELICSPSETAEYNKTVSKVGKK
jgi:hypothetical protein